MMYDWVLSKGFEPIIICTKADKISRGAIQKNLKIIREKLKCRPGTVMIPFSATEKTGKDEILNLMEEILGLDQEEQ
jgi:GTP-binding protein